MLKPNRNLKSKYKYKNKKIVLKIKALQRLRKILKHKPYFINPTFQGILNAKLENKIKSKITIKVTPNNVFCTFQNMKKNKTLIVSSAGKYNLNISRKTLKFGNKIIVQNFFEEIKDFIKKETIILNIQGPIKVRKSILKQISILLKGVKLIINVNELKCFNGCRPAKKKRKKQKGLRIFK